MSARTPRRPRGDPGPDSARRTLPSEVTDERRRRRLSSASLAAKFNRSTPFFIGLTGALGVAVAYMFVRSIADVAQVLTIIGIALFLGVGLQPAVLWLGAPSAFPSPRRDHDHLLFPGCSRSLRRGSHPPDQPRGSRAHHELPALPQECRARSRVARPHRDQTAPVLVCTRQHHRVHDPQDGSRRRRDRCRQALVIDDGGGRNHRRADDLLPRSPSPLSRPSGWASCPPAGASGWVFS